MPRFHAWIAALLGVLALAAAPRICNADSSRPLRRVFMLHSFGQQFEPFHTIGTTFRTELSLHSPGPIEYYEVSLETARFAEGEVDQPLADYVRALCAKQPMDLIVPIGAPAFRFAARHQGDIFSNVPILVAGIEERHLKGTFLGSRTAVVTFSLDLVRFVEDILHILPGTTYVSIALGSSPLETYWAAEMRKAWQGFTERIEFSWLDDQSLAGMQARVAKMPAHSAIVFGFIGVDAMKVPYEQAGALDALSAAATAPMFGFFEPELGHGIVGGRMIDVRRVGTTSAQVAIRILGGEPAESIAIIPVAPAKPIFDGNELNRWGIHSSQLPAGSEVRFSRPTLWQAHRWKLTALVSLIAFEAGLILLLMKNRQRLRTTRAELLKNEENIRLAARAARLGFWTLDIDRDRLWITDEGRDLFGWSKTEPVGFERFLETLRPKDREPAKREMRRALSGGVDFEREHQIVLADGRERWIATRGRAQKNGEGKPFLLSGVSMDITSRQRAIHEAQELRRELSHTSRLSLLSQFTTSLAHELGQPLGAIQRNADAAELFLKAHPPDLVEIHSIVTDVRNDCQRAGLIIERLHAMLGHREIAVQNLVWNEVAHEAANIVRADSQARGISLEIETPLGLPHLKGDRVHIEQVLINLIANAMDAIDTSPNGERRVTISARAKSNGTVECSVHDTGPGIPAQCLSGIFDPFVSTKANGMGMGLPISQTLIETMGGRLWADDHSGKGATFRFTIPVADS